MIRLALASLLVLVPLLPPADAPRFEPRAGAVLRITFESEVELELVSSEMTVDGSSHASGPAPEMTFEVTGERVFVDRWEAVDGGRLTRLARTFETLAEERVEVIEEHDGGDERTLEADSDLEGAEVLFARDADDWEAESEDVDDDLLEGLVAELDLSGFLPADEIVEGDEWEVPVAALRDVLEPGGDVHLDHDRPSGLPAVSLDELDGEIRAALGGARDEDGVEVVAIELEVDVTAEEDLELEDGGEVRTLALELEGELLWDTAAGRFHALELSGEATRTVVQSRTVALGGRDFETERTTGLAGEARFRLRAEDE